MNGRDGVILAALRVSGLRETAALVEGLMLERDQYRAALQRIASNATGVDLDRAGEALAGLAREALRPPAAELGPVERGSDTGREDVLLLADDPGRRATGVWEP